MTKIPVVFTFDKRIILGAAVTIKSLIDRAKADTSYDIYVYHPDIDDKTAGEFKKMLEGTNHSITFEYISTERFKGAPINKGGSWTEIVYYRLLIPELLPQYEKVIYADTDVLFKDDLSDIYNLDISDYECAAVAMEPNNENMICHKYFPENKNALTFISSFIVFNSKKMREENFVQRIFDTIKTFNTRLKFFDVDALNITCNKIYELPFRYGVFQSMFYHDDWSKSYEFNFLKHVYSEEELRKETRNVVMLHYAGKPGKPWRRKHIPEDYQDCLNKLPKSLKKFTFRDMRKRLFSKV